MALENLGDIDKQTISGAVSTATHGTGSRFRNLSSVIEAMELVLADGTLLEVSAEPPSRSCCRRRGSASGRSA